MYSAFYFLHIEGTRREISRSRARAEEAWNEPVYLTRDRVSNVVADKHNMTHAGVLRGRFPPSQGIDGCA